MSAPVAARGSSGRTTRRPRRLRGWSVRHLLAVAALVALAAGILVPILYTLNTALKTDVDFAANRFGLTWFPSLGALQSAWDQGLMPGSMINSMITSSAAVVILWVVCSMAAYALTLMRFPGRQMIFIFVLASVMIPIQVIMFPLFIQFRDVGLLNSYQGLTMAFVTFGIPLTTFQCAAYFKALPHETLEAARIDGASTLQTLFRVVLPMSKPILAVTGIINFVWTWNDVLLPFLVIQDSDKKPLVAQLAVITQSQFFSTSIPIVAATVVLGFAPTVVVYLVAQRQVVHGVTAGAVK